MRKTAFPVKMKRYNRPTILHLIIEIEETDWTRMPLLAGNRRIEVEADRNPLLKLLCIERWLILVGKETNGINGGSISVATSEDSSVTVLSLSFI